MRHFSRTQRSCIASSDLTRDTYWWLWLSTSLMSLSTKSVSLSISSSELETRFSSGMYRSVSFSFSLSFSFFEVLPLLLPGVCWLFNLRLFLFSFVSCLSTTNRSSSISVWLAFSLDSLSLYVVLFFGGGGLEIRTHDTDEHPATEDASLTTQFLYWYIESPRNLYRRNMIILSYVLTCKLEQFEIMSCWGAVVVVVLVEWTKRHTNTKEQTTPATITVPVNHCWVTYLVATVLYKCLTKYSSSPFFSWTFAYKYVSVSSICQLAHVSSFVSCHARAVSDFLIRSFIAINQCAPLSADPGSRKCASRQLHPLPHPHMMLRSAIYQCNHEAVYLLSDLKWHT